MSDHPASFLDRLKSWPLVLLPHQLLSRVVRMVTRWRVAWFKNALINAFIRLFNVDMDDAVAPDAGSYGSFNDFFTRPLKPSARPLPEGADEVIKTDFLSPLWKQMFSALSHLQIIGEL